MKKRFSEAQIIKLLKEHEQGLSAGDICRRYGIGNSTFYQWKSKYSGLSLSEVKRLKHLEDENKKLKRLVADLALDKTILEDALKKL